MGDENYILTFAASELLSSKGKGTSHPLTYLKKTPKDPEEGKAGFYITEK